MIIKNIIQGDRIILKELQPKIKTAKEVYRSIQRNREQLESRLDWIYKIKSVRDEYKFIRKKFRGKEIEYGIYHNGIFIGCIGLFNIDPESERAELGVRLDSKYTRCGYMTEAINLVIKETRAKRIQAKVDIKNKKSKNLLKRCCFKQEGTMKEYRYSPYNKGSRTMILYSHLLHNKIQQGEQKNEKLNTSIKENSSQLKSSSKHRMK